MAEKKENKKAEKKSLRKVLVGEVIKLSSMQTVKVRVETKFQHPKYGRIVKVHKNYLSHVPANLHGKIEVGAEVTIGETIPVSKSKKWEIIEVIK